MLENRGRHSQGVPTFDGIDMLVMPLFQIAIALERKENIEYFIYLLSEFNVIVFIYRCGW